MIADGKLGSYDAKFTFLIVGGKLQSELGVTWFDVDPYSASCIAECANGFASRVHDSEWNSNTSVDTRTCRSSDYGNSLICMTIGMENSLDQYTEGTLVESVTSTSL